MDYEKNITVAFSGHRTYQGEACEELRGVVARLYDEGYRRFLCGMAWGFDLAAGEAVAELKRAHSDVELIAVVPYEGFYRLFHAEDAEQYRRVADAADAIVVVSESEGKVAYRLRNDYLVENSSVVVAWFNGVPRGGTAYTVRRARRKGVRIENLYPQSQMELEF
jgi:uncharacterized phage-like protein YoqJ